MRHKLSGPALLMRQAGQFVTVQDGGRTGWKRFGVPRGGPMDPFSLAVANALVSNPPGTQALEFMFVGGEYALAAEAADLAVTGGNFTLLHNGVRVSSHRSVRLVRGDTLRVGGAPDAVWGYLAVGGGFAAPIELGSASTNIAAQIGGLGGRALREGDAVKLNLDQPTAGQDTDRVFHGAGRPKTTPVRVILGPQDDHFAPDTIDAFLTEEFSLTHHIDRMGYNLAGPPLAHARGAKFISDGVVPGSIQVSGAGQLIALFADCQPTGGYPKIATVISADRGRLAQTRPGRSVRFEAVCLHTAHLARQEYLIKLNALERVVMPNKRLALEQEQEAFF